MLLFTTTEIQLIVFIMYCYSVNLETGKKCGGIHTFFPNLLQQQVFILNYWTWAYCHTHYNVHYDLRTTVLLKSEVSWTVRCLLLPHTLQCTLFLGQADVCYCHTHCNVHYESWTQQILLLFEVSGNRCLLLASSIYSFSKLQPAVVNEAVAPFNKTTTKNNFYWISQIWENFSFLRLKMIFLILVHGLFIC